ESKTVAKHFRPIGVGNVAQGCRTLSKMETSAEPRAADLVAGALELQATETLEDCMTHAGAGPLIDQIRGTPVKPCWPVLHPERPGHEPYEAQLVHVPHREPKKLDGAAEVEETTIDVKQEFDSAPAHVRKRPDQV